MAQRPAVLENFILKLIGVLEVESGLKPSTRGLTSDNLFNFLQNSQAVFDYEPYGPLRKIVHLFSADLKKVCQLSSWIPFSQGSSPSKKLKPAASCSVKNFPGRQACRRDLQNSSALGAWLSV
jgi:hypothetical protein